ncbi:uncharacterized protein TM35_001731030, partial [Trypanosoma theileri]
MVLYGFVVHVVSNYWCFFYSSSFWLNGKAMYFKDRRRTRAPVGLLRRALALFVLIACVAVIYVFFMTVTLHDQWTADGHFGVSFERVDDNTMDETLRYIPRSVVDTWAQREYLVVFGIPSVDIE